MQNERSTTNYQLVGIDNLEQHIFKIQDAHETNKMLDEMFFDCIGSDVYEDTHLRSRAIVTYKVLKKLLHCVANNTLQYDDVVLELNINA